MIIPESELNNLLHSKIFNHIPLYISVIDADFNILDANKNFRTHYGPWKNKKCYQVYKRAQNICSNCKAQRTFKDKKTRIFEEEGLDAKGNHINYLVHTIPVAGKNNKISSLIEMSQDITHAKQREIEHKVLFEHVPCYLAIINSDYKIIQANEKLRKTFGKCVGKHCFEVYKGRKSICENCPAELSFKDGKEHKSTHIGINKKGKETHYIVNTIVLPEKRNNKKCIMEIMTDITEVKELEEENLKSERLSAVGETVAGLAHSVKNILMGVEGGMYMLNHGLKNNNKERLSEGWDMLQDNIPRISSLVKDFLSFSKGRNIETTLLDPNILVDEIISLYSESSIRTGVRLKRKPRKAIKPVPLDHKGIHTCLTNLVSNAIDACHISTKKNCTVTIGVEKKKELLIFTVKDSGCGMDYEIQQNVFTTFFTTKGGEGTGLGLLTTRKIVQEHGGQIFLESRAGKGSEFRIEFPYKNLNKLSQTMRS